MNNDMLLGIVVGLFGGVLFCRFAVQRMPRIAERMGLLEPEDNEQENEARDYDPGLDFEPGPPAVDPWSIPTSTTKEEAPEKAKEIEHKLLRKIVGTLHRWNPRRHRNERPYHGAFQRLLVAEGFDPEGIKHHPRIKKKVNDQNQATAGLFRILSLAMF